MAWSRACFYVLVAVALFFGDGAHAGRSLQQAASSGSASGSPSCPSPATVNVSLEAYSGIWYEIASTALIRQFEASDQVCNLIRLSLITSGNLTGSIRDREEGYNTTSGEYHVFVGYDSVDSPGRLAITFSGAPSGDYSIIYLSGNVEEKYKTAVAYSCDEDSGFQALFILLRKPELDDDESVGAILEFARSQGIVLEAGNQLVLTPQDAITCGRNF